MVLLLFHVITLHRQNRLVTFRRNVGQQLHLANRNRQDGCHQSFHSSSRFLLWFRGFAMELVRQCFDVHMGYIKVATSNFMDFHRIHR